MAILFYFCEIFPHSQRSSCFLLRKKPEKLVFYKNEEGRTPRSERRLTFMVPLSIVQFVGGCRRGPGMAKCRWIKYRSAS